MNFASLLGATPMLYRIAAIAMLCISLFGYGYLKGLQHGELELELFQAKVEAVSAAQAARTAETIRQQQRTTQDISNEHKRRLADLTDYYNDRLRSKRPGINTLPAIPNTASGVDAAAAYPPSFIYDCAVTTLQLESLQGWITSQSRGQ